MPFHGNSTGDGGLARDADGLWMLTSHAFSSLPGLRYAEHTM